MEKVVHQLDVSVFSLPNLRHGIQHGGRNKSKRFLLEIIECYSDIKEDFEIPSFITKFSDLVLMLHWVHVKIYGDTFSLRMPPNWSEDYARVIALCAHAGRSLKR